MRYLLYVPHALLILLIVAVFVGLALPETHKSQDLQPSLETKKVLEERAKRAFAQIKVAQENYAPLGADPAQYNANVTAAYRAWEKASEAAYGKNWKEAKLKELQGAVQFSCTSLTRPGAQCTRVYPEADEIFPPLEGMLMKCPSWRDPTGAIFNPRNQEHCDRRGGNAER